MSVLLSYFFPDCGPIRIRVCAMQYMLLALTFATIDGLVMLSYAGSDAGTVQLLPKPN